MNQAMIEWAESEVEKRGERLTKSPIDIRHMPWSQVVSLVTEKNTYYLKAMAESFAYEPALLAYLNQQHFAHIPNCIAANSQLHCFLMQDAGTNLRQKLKEKYDLPLVAQALRDYAVLQIDCISHVAQLLECGVADYRLERLPMLFDELLSQHRDMIIEDGLSLEDLSALLHAKAAFIDLCQQLQVLPIPETLEHGDFHDNNLLVKEQRITFHDFGDACVSHPFFSIASFLHSAGRHHGLTMENSEQLLGYYLLPWQRYVDQSTLLEAYKLAYRLRPFVWSLSFVRIYDCEGMTELAMYKGYLADALRTLLNSLR